ASSDAGIRARDQGRVRPACARELDRDPARLDEPGRRACGARAARSARALRGFGLAREARCLSRGTAAARGAAPPLGALIRAELRAALVPERLRAARGGSGP